MDLDDVRSKAEGHGTAFLGGAAEARHDEEVHGCSSGDGLLESKVHVTKR